MHFWIGGIIGTCIGYFLGLSSLAEMLRDASFFTCGVWGLLLCQRVKLKRPIKLKG